MRKACARLAMFQIELPSLQNFNASRLGGCAPHRPFTRVSALAAGSGGGGSKPTASTPGAAGHPGHGRQHLPLAPRRQPAGGALHERAEPRKQYTAAAQAAVLVQPDLSFGTEPALPRLPSVLEERLVLRPGLQLPPDVPLRPALLPKSPQVPNFGYACLNMQLRRRKPACFTNRSCHRRTFEEQGLALVSKLALKNCQDLLPLIEWNHQHGIRLFRLSSNLFPWASEYELEQLPDFEAIEGALGAAGALARQHQQRLTSHPPHFVKLASPDDALVSAGLANLELHSRMFDLLGYQPSHWNKINIHVGGVYGNKTKAMDRFARSFHRLSDACRARLTVENDDRPSSYSVRDLTALHGMTGIPITFDFHHHRFCEGGQSQEEAFLTALETWPASVRPVVHWSESPECPVRARRHPYGHSAFVYGPILLHGKEADVDVMIESKGGEASLLLYRDRLHPAHMQRLADAPAGI